MRQMVEPIGIEPMTTSTKRVGGANRDRTDDLLLAKQALSQLSYGPIFQGTLGGSGRSCTPDLTLIRGAL